MQKGVGFIFNIAKSSAIADRTFSPPDIRFIFCSFFPGGSTFISMLALSSSPSPSISSALPPWNKSLNVSLKL